jgi:hypothetical protein
LTSGNIPQESAVRASKGRALQLAHGLDFLSIQAYRLWMEYPSRGKMKNIFAIVTTLVLVSVLFALPAIGQKTKKPAAAPKSI